MIKLRQMKNNKIKLISILLISIVHFSFTPKQYHYSTSKVEYYSKQNDSDKWIFNSSEQRNDFFIFNSDFSKMDWISPAGKGSFILWKEEKDGNDRFWHATDFKGVNCFIMLKEKEIRIIHSMEFQEFSGSVTSIFIIDKSWEDEYWDQ